MMVKTASGIMLHGEISKDPGIRNAGQKQLLSFSLRVHSVKNDDGKWESQFVDINVWNSIDAWDGMLQKGDYVTVFARELRSREYNGKIYYSADAMDIQPGGLVTFRWMQQIVDMIPAVSPAATPEMVETDEPTPFDPPPEPEPVQTSLAGGQMYPGEDAPIYDDADDLPF